MNAEDLKAKIKTIKGTSQVDVMDTTGTEDHFHAVVVSSSFEGLRTIQRHQVVFAILKNELDSGEVHALELKTFTPEEYERI